LLVVLIGVVVPVYALVWLLGGVEPMAGDSVARALTVHFVVLCLGFAGVWLGVNDIQDNSALDERQRAAWIYAMAVALPVAAVVYLIRFTGHASNSAPGPAPGRQP
jgi:hypothetical protein